VVEFIGDRGIEDLPIRLTAAAVDVLASREVCWTQAPGAAHPRVDRHSRGPLIRQPTLILAGNDDPIIPLVKRPDHARTAAQRLPARHDELGPLVWRFVTSHCGGNASKSS